MSKKPEGIVFIGNKYVNDYVLAIVTLINRYNTVKVKSRGQNIGKAVICSQIATRTLKDIKISDVLIYDKEVKYQGENKKEYIKELTHIELTLTKS